LLIPANYLALSVFFSLDAAGTLTTLHQFSRADGANPNAGVIQGTDGRLYGTTTNGGAYGYGTVFDMNITGGLTTLHDFVLSDGANPVSELFQGNDGAFYGAAPVGGPKDGGVIYRVSLATSPPDEYFEIVSRNGGKCLDVYGASTDAAWPAIQWTCHGGANQQWRLEPAGGGAVHIIARHSGQALDVYGGLLDDITPVIQWPLHDNQVWTLEPASDGYVSIVARHSGKALDVEYASTDDGARVIQYTPHGGTNQQWLFRRVESTASPLPPTRLFRASILSSFVAGEGHLRYVRTATIPFTAPRLAVASLTEAFCFRWTWPAWSLRCTASSRPKVLGRLAWCEP
jgi:uncharacterized repeat protein (TIGR03803 family)